MSRVKEKVRSHVSGGYSVGLNEVARRLRADDKQIIEDLRRDDWRGVLSDCSNSALVAELEAFRADVAAGRYE